MDLQKTQSQFGRVTFLRDDSAPCWLPSGGGGKARPGPARSPGSAGTAGLPGPVGGRGGGPFSPGLLRPRRFPGSSGPGSDMGAARRSRLLPPLLLLLLAPWGPRVSGEPRSARRRWPVPYR